MTNAVNTATAVCLLCASAAAASAQQGGQAPGESLQLRGGTGPEEG